jgi:hypothetical protein
VVDPAATLPKKRGKKSGKTNLTLAEAPEKKTPAEQLEELDKPKPKKEGTLQVEQPPTPTVANGRMKVFFDKPFFSKYKDTVLISLQCSVPLTDKHMSVLPKAICDAYIDVQKKGRSRINLRDLPPQQVGFFLESDRKGAMAVVNAAKLVNANLAVVERKGEGTARKIIRFAFRVQCENSPHVEEFSTKNLQNDFWVEMSRAQGELWDKE